jgi:hypothetical protein
MKTKPILTAAAFIVTALAAFEAGRISSPPRTEGAADE